MIRTDYLEKEIIFCPIANKMINVIYCTQFKSGCKDVKEVLSDPHLTTKEAKEICNRCVYNTENNLQV